MSCGSHKLRALAAPCPDVWSLRFAIAMSPLLDTDPSLTPDQVVYRTLDFFGAASIVSTRQLMFSRADTFPDRNEGIERLLAQLESSGPNSCGGMGWSDVKSARIAHNDVKRSHYISCWSKTPESVAMWSLYSPDCCSVRISTRIGKLQAVVDSLLEKYSVFRIREEDRGNLVVAAVSGRIAPVTYVSLQSVSSRVSRRLKSRERLAERYARKGLPMPQLNEVSPRYWQREEKRRFNDLRLTCSLKDSSFEHEAEVRLAVRLGEEKCCSSVFEAQALLDPTHQYHRLVKHEMSFWSFVRKTFLPERESVACPSEFIESVALDPRCPAHKATFMKAWFLAHGIPVVQSTCFGYLPDTFDVFPEK